MCVRAGLNGAADTESADTESADTDTESATGTDATDAEAPSPFDTTEEAHVPESAHHTPDSSEAAAAMQPEPRSESHSGANSTTPADEAQPAAAAAATHADADASSAHSPTQITPKLLGKGEKFGACVRDSLASQGSTPDSPLDSPPVHHHQLVLGDD
jgi:hypothetical protein